MLLDGYTLISTFTSAATISNVHRRLKIKYKILIEIKCGNVQCGNHFRGQISVSPSHDLDLSFIKARISTRTFKSHMLQVLCQVISIWFNM